MTRITTLADPRIAPYRQLADPAAIARAGLFVAEGRLVVRRLLASARFVTHSVLVTEVASRALAPVLEPLAPAIPIFVTSQPLMNEIAGFHIHRGCLALAERPPASPLHELPLDDYRRLVVLEGVNNPDNIGGIFRSAAALGADAVLLGPHCGDPLYRKAVRTSMAAVLSLPFADAGAWPGALDGLRGHGFRVLALTPSTGARPLHTLDPRMARAALLVGGEGHGLSQAALTAADEQIQIPMSGRVASLNVTVAASIALHHVTTPRGL